MDLRRRLLSLESVERLREEDVKIYDWPFCDVIATITDAANEVDTAVKKASILLNKPQPVFWEGEYLVVKAVNNNPQSGYLYLDLVDAAGDVVHLMPTPSVPDNRVDGFGQILVGSEDAQSCLQLQCYEVAPPTGVVWLSRPGAAIRSW